MIPAKRKRPKMGLRESTVLKSERHKKFVRSFVCSILGRNGHECEGKTEPHHVKSRGAGGGDDQCAPLCSKAHQEGHTIGWETFEKKYGVDLEAIGKRLWQISPARVT